MDEITEQVMREEMEDMGMDEFSIDVAIEAAKEAESYEPQRY